MDMSMTLVTTLLMASRSLVSGAHIVQNETTAVSENDGTVMEDEDGVWIEDFRFAVEGVTQSVVGVIGIVGNLLSIAVLNRRDMDLKPIFRQILIALISFDFFFIVFNLLLFSLPHLCLTYQQHVFPFIVPYVLPLAQIAQTGSIYSTLAVAIERYISVCHPHFIPSHCSGTISIVSLVSFSFVFNICRFLEFKTVYAYQNETQWDPVVNETVVKNVSVPYPESTDLRKNRIYSQIFMSVMLIMQGIIPLVVLIGLNARIYFAIRARTQRLATMTLRQRRDLTVAAVLVGIILLFIVCHSFKFIVNVYEAYLMYSGIDLENAFSEIIDCLVSLSHLSVTLNSSCNFVIYCYKDQNFRATLLKMLKLGPRHRGQCHSSRSRTTAGELATVTVHGNGVVITKTKIAE